MFRKITALAAALAAVATLALVAAPANALPPLDYPGEDTVPVFTSEPTGTHTMEVGKNYETGDEYEGCQKKAKTANAYLDIARRYEAKGLAAAAQYFEQRADEIAGEANKEGCNLYQPA